MPYRMLYRVGSTNEERLLVPSSDYLGHPFPQMYNQMFERLHDGENFDVHVVRFRGSFEVGCLG